MKIIRTSTIPDSLNNFCRGLLTELKKHDYDVVAISSPGEGLEQIAMREDVKTYGVHMERRISPWKDMISLLKLFKIFLRERPTMVHSMTPKAGLLCMAAAWLANVPVRVHTFTGLVFPTSTGFKRKVLMWTDRLTCACATHVIPEGEGVKRDLLDNGITKKPIRVLGHGNVKGIDLDYFNPTDSGVQEEGAKIRKPGIFTFIFVGRIVKDKGIDELVSAFSRLYNEKGNIRLIIVGEYENSIDPIGQAADRIIQECPGIDYVGIQDDVRPWYAASDALVFPSYREGFPNVVIEAGAMNLPSIVTDINGSREIIIDGSNGMIIPPRSEKAVYDAMKTFLEDKEKVNNMAKMSRAMIASRYEKSYVRKCLYDFYDEILPKEVKDI